MNGELQKIDWNEIYNGILWVEDWWDGIVSGVAKFNECRIYFNCIDEDEKGNRTFVVYKLPEEIWQLIDERHNDFKSYVGDYYDFKSGKPNRKTKNLQPQSEHKKFYEKWRKVNIKFDDRWQFGISKLEISI